MRKAFVFLVATFLLIPLFLSSHQRAFAECKITSYQIETTSEFQPTTSIQQNFKGKMKITTENCLPKNIPLQIVAYPQTGQPLEEFYKCNTNAVRQLAHTTFVNKPVESDNSQSQNGFNLEANLNFQDEGGFVSMRYCIGDYPIIKPHVTGPWNILVCLTNDKAPTKQCDKAHVASGTINIVSVAPTPTPTPELDQPVIDVTKQSQCIFQVGRGDIHLTATNITPTKTYHWWWTEGGGGGTVVPDSSADPNNLLFTIPEASTGDRKTTDKKSNGYLLCIDLNDKKREGANCLRLYFRSFDPKDAGLDVSCSEQNAGNITPPPESPLPPCSKWLYLKNDVPIPTQSPLYNDPSYKSRKCGTVQTGIGNISTDPAGLIKSIMGLLLGVSGGIAVLLIIVSGFKFMASQGNPEAVQGARERLISAIVGLLFIIFSLAILQIIGVDILKIPGFSK